MARAQLGSAPARGRARRRDVAGDCHRRHGRPGRRDTEINRHRRRRPELLDDPDLPGACNLAAAGPSAEQLVLDRAFDTVVEAALLDLAPAMRQAVLLVDVDELSYAEASAVLGIPEGTLTSRLHRARRRIRQRIQTAGLSPRRHP